MIKVIMKIIAYQRQFAPIVQWNVFKERLIYTKRRHANFYADSPLAWIWEEVDQPAVFLANPWGTREIAQPVWRRHEAAA